MRSGVVAPSSDKTVETLNSSNGSTMDVDSDSDLEIEPPEGNGIDGDLEEGFIL